MRQIQKLKQQDDPKTDDNFESFISSLARTIEAVEGGELVLMLLSKLSSLKQFYPLNTEVHKRYQIDVYQDLKP